MYNLLQQDTHHKRAKIVFRSVLSGFNNNLTQLINAAGLHDLTKASFSPETTPIAVNENANPSVHQLDNTIGFHYLTKTPHHTSQNQFVAVKRYEVQVLISRLTSSVLGINS